MSEFIANLEHKTKKYPCMICLIKACCSELCELLTADKQSMYESLMDDNICPDCSSIKVAPFEGKVRCSGCGHIFVVYPGCYLINERRLQ